MSDVTRILNAIEQGDAQATDELLPLVYAANRLQRFYEYTLDKGGFSEYNNSSPLAWTALAWAVRIRRQERHGVLFAFEN